MDGCFMRKVPEEKVMPGIPWLNRDAVQSLAW